MKQETKIKVLECIRQGQIGGGESHLLSLLQNMDRDRFDPVVLSFTDGPMIEKVKEMGIDSRVIYTETPFDIKKWKAVKRYLKEKDIKLVHAHGTRASSNVLWAARSLGIPVVYTIHGWSFHQDQPWLVRKVRVFAETYLTKKSARNISVSASNQQAGKKFIPKLSSVVVNNGIDHKKFDATGQFHNVREELGIGSGVLLVLFLARFTSHKQPLKLIDAFAKIAGEMPAMRLLMVGDGDEKEQAETMISNLGLSGRVILSPFRQDVPDVLAAADIYVLPSLWEGMPIGLIEAMAMGKAVIATNVDGSKEMIQHDRNGILVSTDNLVDNLAASLHRLASDAALRRILGEQALNTVKDSYNAKKMTREIEDIYKEVLSDVKETSGSQSIN